MIFAFVLDTSGSMNQRSANGMTMLDCAKAAIEHFLKVRARDAAQRNDRYFLFSCEEGMGAIKSGWKESFSAFVNTVKQLKAVDMTALGAALKTSFDHLNQYRLQSNIDNYGLGRNPWFLDPTMVIVLTDGGELTASSGAAVPERLMLPSVPAMPGSELTREPFRWDQRLFAIALRLAGADDASDGMMGTDEKPAAIDRKSVV